MWNVKTRVPLKYVFSTKRCLLLAIGNCQVKRRVYYILYICQILFCFCFLFCFVLLFICFCLFFKFMTSGGTRINAIKECKENRDIFRGSRWQAPQKVTSCDHFVQQKSSFSVSINIFWRGQEQFLQGTNAPVMPPLFTTLSQLRGKNLVTFAYSLSFN